MPTIFDPIPTADARSVAELEQTYFELPESTETGPVCGSCSQHARRSLGDRRAQVRHATAAHVRYCFGANYEAEAEARAEALVERRTEQYFEGAFREPSGEDLYEEARERWLESLQDR